MKKAFVITVLILVAGSSFGQQFTDLYGDYLGQTPPGDTPVVFAPGIVSTIFMEHSTLAISPDGNETFWWVRPGPRIDSSLYNPKTWISAKTVKRIGGKWTKPMGSPYCGAPTFSPDGSRLYFESVMTSNKPDGPYYAERKGDKLGEPKNLGLVRRFPQLKTVYCPSVTHDGTLYFSSDTVGRGMLKDHVLYRAKLVNGEYTRVEMLSSCINLPLSWNYTPFIAPDDSYLVFTSNRPGGRDSFGDLYISFHNVKEGTWSEPVNMGEPINTWSQESYPGLSPDGKYLFYTSWVDGRQADVFWVSANIIARLMEKVKNK